MSEHLTHVNLYRYSRHTLEHVLIQQHAGLFAQESEDGKYLRFIDFAQESLVNRELVTGVGKTLRTNIENLKELMPGELRLSDDEQQVFAVAKEGSKRLLKAYSLYSSEPKTLMGLPDNVIVSDINGAGDEVLFVMNPAFSGDIMKLDFH